MWMQRIAVTWIAWELTESPFWVGVVAFCDLCPAVIASPIAGALADRVDRMRLTSITQIVAATHAIVMALLLAADLMSIWILLVLTLVLGVNGSVAQPARQSLIPSLVPRSDLPSAIALNSLTYNASRFIGPALAGPMIAYTGVIATITANAVCYLVACWMTQFLRPTPVNLMERAPPTGLIAETWQGVRYVAQHAGIGPLLLYAATLGLLVRAIPEILPPFIDQLFDRGVNGLAIMTSVMGVSSILGGVVVAARGRIEGLTRVAVVSGMGIALSCAGFVATSSFTVGVVCAGLMSAATTMHGISLLTLAQSSCDNAMRGRVVSLWGMITRVTPALGALGIGALSTVFGLRVPVLVASGLCVMIWIWGMMRLPHMAAALEQKD